MIIRKPLSSDRWKLVSTWSVSLMRSLNFYFSQRSQLSAPLSLVSIWSLWSLRSLESVFFIIAMIAAITEPFFFLSDHSDHNDHMETRLYRWRFFSLLLPVILEKWMIYRFRPSQKVWTKFRQNLHQSYFVCLFFFSSNQFKLRQKALKNYLYKRILKTAKLSQNKKLRSSNLTGVETPKLRLFRSTSTERKRN